MPKRRGRPSAAQTPSPKSDKIVGSSKNKKGSASTSKGASKIVLSDKTTTALKKKLQDFKEKYPRKDNISLSDLKAVYRRGSGAFSGSHRPGISRAGWSYARTNKFLQKAAGNKVKAAYVQDDDLLNYHLGGDMTMHLAPNGKPSNLNHEQWHLVRTPEFKEWFGDWENSPETASKVVDENGEPMMLWHGTNKKFNKFDLSKIGTSSDMGYFGQGFYFAPTELIADYYGDITIKVFVNLKNPLSVVSRNQIQKKYNTNDSLELREEIIKDNFDGVLQIIIPNNKKKRISFGEIIAFYPNQIKLADGSNTTFDSANPDIRYDGGGEVTDCKEYIMQNKSLFANGYFFDMQKLSNINDPYGQVPKNLDFTLIAYNSGGQNNLGLIDTINPTILEDKLSQICNLSKSQSFIAIKYFINNAKRLNDIKQIKNKKMVIVDRDNIVSENISYAEGGLIAPNGKPSNLTPEQYKLVRTPEFKAWFGDWQNDSENASKVVDENGEPLVVYRGIPESLSHKYEFDFKTSLMTNYNRYNKFGFYFTDNELTAKIYAKGFAEQQLGIENETYLQKNEKFQYSNYEQYQEASKKYEVVLSYFLNIRNLLNLTPSNTNFPKYKDGQISSYLDSYKYRETLISLVELLNLLNIKEDFLNYYKGTSRYIEFNDLPLDHSYNIKKDVYSYFTEFKGNNTKSVKSLAQYLKDKILEKYDGIVFFEATNSPSNVYVTFKSNQIKLADGSNSTFDKNNKDIRYEKGGLIAPNGKKSNLTSEQYKLVRTPEFKEWFGDWENDPQNASKVIDENGEPLVVFHGSNVPNINIFKESYDGGYWFTSKYEVAEDFAENNNMFGQKTIYVVFLNIKNPYINNLKGSFLEHSKDTFDTIKEVIDSIDGIILKNALDYVENPIISDIYNCFEPTQIKIANGSNKTFDINNPNIRFTDGGIIKNEKELSAENLAWIKYNNLHIGHEVYVKRDSFVNPYEFKGKIIGYKIKKAKVKVKKSNKGFSSLDIIYVVTDIGENILATNIVKNKTNNSNPDIRYEEGGNVGQEITCRNCGWHWNTNQSEAYDKYVCHKCGFDNRTYYEPSPMGKYEKGGKINNMDNKKALNGSTGGMLVGNRHSEGGIKAINKSSNTPLEMEGGEVVITRNAVSDGSRREFEGKMMTNKEILSKINESGGGVSFAEGGKVHECACSGKQYKYGGRTMSDHDIVKEMREMYPNDFAKGVKEELSEHRKTLEELVNKKIKVSDAADLIVTEHLRKKPNYYKMYDKGGEVDLDVIKVTSFKDFIKVGEPVKSPYISEDGALYYQVKDKNSNKIAYYKNANIFGAKITDLLAYKTYLYDNFSVNMKDLPAKKQNALLQGNTAVVQNTNK
jgi:hypothetical protein